MDTQTQAASHGPPWAGTKLLDSTPVVGGGSTRLHGMSFRKRANPCSGASAAPQVVRVVWTRREASEAVPTLRAVQRAALGTCEAASDFTALAPAREPGTCVTRLQPANFGRLAAAAEYNARQDSKGSSNAEGDTDPHFCRRRALTPPALTLKFSRFSDVDLAHPHRTLRQGHDRVTTSVSAEIRRTVPMKHLHAVGDAVSP